MTSPPEAERFKLFTRRWVVAALAALLLAVGAIVGVYAFVNEPAPQRGCNADAIVVYNYSGHSDYSDFHRDPNRKCQWVDNKNGHLLVVDGQTIN